MFSFSFQKPYWRPVYLVLLLLLTSGISLAALVQPFSSPLSAEPQQVGLVAPQDIIAPRDLTFKSDILTRQQQDRAAAAVAKVYSPPDTSIARKQLEEMRTALAYITVVREDAYSTMEQKQADLNALENIQLSPDTEFNILNLTNSRWQAVQQEAIVVLEQVMRSTIREDQLIDVRRSVPTLISLSLPEDQASIVAQLVSGFVTPNSLYDKKLTEAARQQARDAIAPVMNSYVAGETIVQHGSVITDINLETLQAFGLVQPKFRWQDLAGAGALMVLCMAFLVIYLLRSPGRLMNGTRGYRSLMLVALLFLLFLVTARLAIPGHAIIPYLFPLAAYSLVVASLFGAEPALVTSLPLVVMVTYGLPYSLELTLYYLLGSFLGVLTLRRAQRITHFFWAGVAVAACGAAVVIAYRLPEPATDWLGLASLILVAIVNGVAASSITLALQFFLAQLLGKTTALQLIELSRPDNPLLQLILHNAPGTYQHSLQVANLAEQAAEHIGADALLTRVGAMYHDAGKSMNSMFFIENQIPGNLNSHDDLAPDMSAMMIIQHVLDGVELARKYRLPARIQDFILEHHGDMLTRYQYSKALDLVGGDENKVDPEKFRYPGPRPQSRETALVMLADGCEARVRAERPREESELRAIIKSVISTRVADGALDDTHLTLHDLYVIEDSFTATLKGIYHPRLQYPKFDVVTAPAELPETAEAEVVEDAEASVSTEVPTQERLELPPTISPEAPPAPSPS